MVEIYKQRELKVCQAVECYRNLHKNSFSIRDKKSKLVVASGKNFVLKNVVLKVSESGRLRVVREQVKNVHAFIVGDYVGCAEIDTSELVELYYNPYKLKNFVRADTMQEVLECSVVYFTTDKCYLVK